LNPDKYDTNKSYIDIQKLSAVVPNPGDLLYGIPSFNYDLPSFTTEPHRKTSHKPDNSPEYIEITAKTRLLRTDSSHENCCPENENRLYQPRQPPLNIPAEPLSSNPRLRPELHI
jgi:hypothetical protein